MGTVALNDSPLPIFVLEDVRPSAPDAERVARFELLAVFEFKGRGGGGFREDTYSYVVPLPRKHLLSRVDEALQLSTPFIESSGDLPVPSEDEILRIEGEKRLKRLSRLQKR